MCGICGLVQRDDACAPDQNTISRMISTMIHRGPDGEGAYVDERAALGATRLSIIDLQGGAQPIANEDATLHVVFNGEIYNYREWRRFLERKGHRFRTHTDTEVILHLYEEFGDDVPRHLDGMFAFAIWDSRRKQLFAARDRMGIKPFYYARTPEGLTFASELRTMLSDKRVERQLDPVALNEYLSYEFVPTPRTIVSGVFKLRPGHTLRTDGRNVTTTQYWTPSLGRSESQPPVRWRDFAGQLRGMLASAVSRELVSDVPVGILLSGGIDSSAVAAFMVKAYPGTVDSFSVSFDEPSFDETRYAAAMAARLGTRHHNLRLTSAMAAGVAPRLPDLLDEPLGDASFIPTYLLSKFASEHVKVVLGGDGSDELFAGYPTLVAHRLIEYYERTVPWTIRAYVVPALIPRLPVSFNYFSREFKIRRFLSGRSVPLEARHHRWMGSFLDEEKRELFQEWLSPVHDETYLEAYRHGRECDARRPVNRILHDDMKLYLEGDILVKLDRASMAASLEARVPFLNRAMVDFATSLPLELKLRRLTGKYLLRRAMADLVPKEIIARRKQGFAMPVAHWLTSELRDLMLDLLSPARIARRGLFRPEYVSRLVSDHLERRKDNRKLLWTLLVFEMWSERHLLKI